MPRARKHLTFRPLEFNVLQNQYRIRETEWTKRWTQKDLNCYYHRQFEQSPEFNYHVSVWNRSRENDDRVDHHATMFDNRNGQDQRIHYGFCRSNEEIVWTDQVDRNDPKQMKVVKLFEMFEAEKDKLLPRDLINRLNVPQA